MKKKIKLILLGLGIIIIIWFVTQSPWTFFSKEVENDLNGTSESETLEEFMEKYTIDENGIAHLK